jgi:hypothetical protein
MIAPSGEGTLLAMALLAALPLAGVAWARRARPEHLRLSIGRWFLAYSLAFATLLGLAGGPGIPWVMASMGLLTGYLGSRRGLAPLYRWLFGAEALKANPHLVEQDALRLHLFMMILAVVCFTAGIVFATFPGLR